MTTPKSQSIERDVHRLLAGVVVPDQSQSIVEARMVESVQADDHGHVVVVLSVDPKMGQAMEPLRQEVERQVQSLEGVEKVSVVLTAQRSEEVQKRVKNDPHGMAKNPPVDVPARHIIVVASGKGGVGKSTVSANLAAHLSKSGHKVGLLDADIYGPSQPLMMGDEVYKPPLNDEKKLVPLVRHGMQIMSIGFVTDQSQALVWRGPMVQTAFYQLLRDVAWGYGGGELDYLVIDLPPGTGDVQLTLAQKVKVSGAVIVSTPQDIALIDARRAVEMFRKTDVPILGLVENMSVHVCSQCGHEEHIFGHGGAKDEAERLGIPYLGALPLSKTVRLQSDAGEPIVLSHSDGVEAQAFGDICAEITRVLG